MNTYCQNVFIVEIPNGENKDEEKCSLIDGMWKKISIVIITIITSKLSSNFKPQMFTGNLSMLRNACFYYLLLKYDIRFWASGLSENSL